MYSLFGQFGGKNLSSFRKLKQEFSDIKDNYSILEIESTKYIAAIGQSHNNIFFPLHAPFVDKEERRLFALQGYLFKNSSFPENANDAQEMIQLFGKQLLEQIDFVQSDEWGGLFNFISSDLSTGRFAISNDLSGIIPMHYYLDLDGALLFSTHLRPLARTVQASIDEISVIHHSACFHTFGKRTLFRGISRLNPGETLLFDTKTRKFDFRQNPGYYSDLDSYPSDDHAADILWSDFLSGITPFAKFQGAKGILLSGGFDSRLVAAGFSHFNNQLNTVTLGDVDCFETEISLRVGEKIRSVPKIHNPQKDLDLDSMEMARLISSVECANFPYFDSAARILKDQGAISVSTGYGGEMTIGGNAFHVLGRGWSNSKRLQMGIRRSFGLSNNFCDYYHPSKLDHVIDPIYQFFNRMIIKNSSIFSKSYQEIINRAREELRGDIEDEISRLVLNNPETKQQIFERFWFEHQLKHYGRQDLTLLLSLPLVLPTVNPKFLRRCSNLDPSRKVDHGIYLALVRRHLGDLSKIPTANIPINLNYPELLLWVARVWRANNDKNIMHRVMKSHGNIEGHRFGWSNFEIWARQSSFLINYPQYISNNIYSNDFIGHKLQQIQEWSDRVYSAQDLLTYITVSQVVSL